MTPEEMEAKIAEQDEQIRTLSETANKVAELEAKINPPAPDPDEAYKPQSWKGLHDSVDAKAEAAAMRVLEQADKKKEDIRKQEEETLKKQSEDIDKAFDKLQAEGIISESSDKDDEGGKQRRQALGLAVRLGGTDVEAAARILKSAWEQGMEFDYETSRYIRAGSSPSQSRMAPVGSSANRTPANPKGGPINLAGVGGDLDRAQELWEASNKS